MEAREDSTRSSSAEERGSLKGNVDYADRIDLYRCDTTSGELSCLSICRRRTEEQDSTQTYQATHAR